MNEFKRDYIQAMMLVAINKATIIENYFTSPSILDLYIENAYRIIFMDFSHVELINPDFNLTFIVNGEFSDGSLDGYFYSATDLVR